MSIRAIVWAFEQECPSAAAKLVLIKLADHANDDGECWPSQSRVAADCGLTRETVNRQIKALQEAGLLTFDHRVNGTGQHSNRYFLRCDLKSQGGVISNHRGCDLTSQPGVISRHTEPSLEPSKKEASEEANASSGADAPRDPVKELWDRGVKILGIGSRSLLGKARREHGDETVLGAIIACEQERPMEPVEFFLGCLRRAKQEKLHGRRTPVEGIYAGFAAALGDGPADSEPDLSPTVPLLGYH